MSAIEKRALILAFVLFVVGLSARLQPQWGRGNWALEPDPDWQIAAVDSVESLDASVSQSPVDDWVPSQSSTRGPQVSKAKKLPGAPISINTATASQLQGLPGIGPALAQRILKQRKAAGPFRSGADLGKVKGIGEKKLKSVLPFLIFD